MTIATQIKLTYEDIRQLPEDGKRHELIEGEHYMSPAPKTKHQRVITNLMRLISVFVHNNKLGQVFAAPTDVVFSESAMTEPDLIFVSRAKENIIGEDYIDGTPDLLVEILSPSSTNRDHKIKFHLYEKHGVREYWIVSPEAENVQVFILREGKFELLGNFSGAQEIQSRVLVGFTCKASEVFEI